MMSAPIVSKPANLAFLENYGSLSKLVRRQLELTPAHAAFLVRRYQSADHDELTLCDAIADDIYKLAGDDVDEFLKSYQFICDIQKAEEIYFRRHKSYRLKKFSDAVAEVYSNKPYMRSYMRGLLVTQVHWSNHTAALRFYCDRFLGAYTNGSDLLEIGPGHGLLLARAVQLSNARSVTGWDISAASLQETSTALHRMGVPRSSVRLQERNLFDNTQGSPAFSAVVFSEVLEHLEEPDRALRNIRSVLRPNGCLFVNVPINSPAPDHIFLLRTPEEAVGFVERHGFTTVEVGAFPATNYTMEKARKHDLTISVCIVARKAG